MTDTKPRPLALFEVELPAPEAAHLVACAAACGMSTPRYLGAHVIRSAYGPLHPWAAPLEVGAGSGHGGPCLREVKRGR